MGQSSVDTKRFLKSPLWVLALISVLAGCASRDADPYYNQSSGIIPPNNQYGDGYSGNGYGSDPYGQQYPNQPVITPEPQVYSGSLPPLTGEPIPPSGAVPPSSNSLMGGGINGNTGGMMGSNMPRSPFEVRKQAPIPADGVHLVESGQTIYDISRQYGVDTADLIKLNRLNPPYNLQAGEALYLTPEALRKETGVKIKLKEDPEPTPDQFAQNLDDTLGGMQKNPAQQPAQTASNNTGQSFDNILGNLNLPSPVAGEDASGNSASSGGSAPFKTVSAGEASSADATQSAQKAVATSKAKTEKAPAKPVVKNPVEGKIAARFGEKFDGKKVNGLVYTGSENGLVKSVQAGKVMYVGEAQGYGQVVLVRHDGGVMTNYANLKKVLVKQGQSIEAGGLIGKIGATNVSKTPQLTFEVREGSKAIDPEKYLR